MLTLANYSEADISFPVDGPRKRARVKVLQIFY